jgi:AcrR family transcriptional regulator
LKSPQSTKSKRPVAATKEPAKAKAEDSVSPLKRAARGTGEQRIVDAAIDFFAEEGFRAPTRDLAKRLGVTQALLYRYFKSKQALIDRVFEEIVSARWDPRHIEMLLDKSHPLSIRLTKFYQIATRDRSKQSVRLFMRAELDNQKLAARYTFPLNEKILIPVITALRQELGLSEPAKKPVLRAERELVMTLHGAIAHMGMRKYIYDSPLPDDLSELVAFNVTCFLEGAIPTIKRLHQKPPRGHLGVRLTGRKGSPIE